MSENNNTESRSQFTKNNYHEEKNMINHLNQTQNSPASYKNRTNKKIKTSLDYNVLKAMQISSDFL